MPSKLGGGVRLGASRVPVCRPHSSGTPGSAAMPMPPADSGPTSRRRGRRRPCRRVGSPSRPTTRAMQESLGRAMPLRSVSCVFAAPGRSRRRRDRRDRAPRGAVGRAGLGHDANAGARAGLTAIARVRLDAARVRVHRSRGSRLPASRSRCRAFRGSAARRRVRVRRHAVPDLGQPPRGSAGDRAPAVGGTTCLDEQRAIAYQRYDEPPRAARRHRRSARVRRALRHDARRGRRADGQSDRAAIWYGPSADLTVHVVRAARSEWILAPRPCPVAPTTATRRSRSSCGIPRPASSPTARRR